MKTKLLTTLVVCALLISLMGCAADKTAQMLQDTADVTFNTEALTEPSADTQAVTPTAETAELSLSSKTATATLCCLCLQALLRISTSATYAISTAMPLIS